MQAALGFVRAWSAGPALWHCAVAPLGSDAPRIHVRRAEAEPVLAALVPNSPLFLHPYALYAAQQQYLL